MDVTFDQQHLDRLADLGWSWAVNFLPRLIAAVAILLVGAMVARWASRAAVEVARCAGHVDITVQPVLARWSAMPC